MPKEAHKVQLLLYRALFNYEFHKYAEELKHLMLLYSKYSQGLIRLGNDQLLLLRAIKMRNLLTWSEMLYAKKGLDLLPTLTPDKLNQKKLSGRLWENYIKPQLSALLNPIAAATPLERLYYLRFLRFLENEQLLSKMGNKQKEDSGFASLWIDTLDDKKLAGNIYDNLTIAEFKFDDQHKTDVSGITLHMGEELSALTSAWATPLFSIPTIIITTRAYPMPVPKWFTEPRSLPCTPTP